MNCVLEINLSMNQKQTAQRLAANRSKIDDIAAEAGLEPLSSSKSTELNAVTW